MSFTAPSQLGTSSSLVKIDSSNCLRLSAPDASQTTTTWYVCVIIIIIIIIIRLLRQAAAEHTHTDNIDEKYT